MTALCRALAIAIGCGGEAAPGRCNCPAPATRDELEQQPLAAQTAAIAGHRAVGADHAMAGDDDGDGVPMVGAADGARPGFPIDRAIWP